MESISFAKSLRHYDLKPSIKAKNKSNYISTKRRSYLNGNMDENIGINMTNDERNTFFTLTQRSRQASVNINSQTVTDSRRSMPSSYIWTSTNETFVDKMSDRRLFDRKFRIENITKNLADSRISNKLQTHSQTAELIPQQNDDDDLPFETAHYYYNNKIPVSTDVYILSKNKNSKVELQKNTKDQNKSLVRTNSTLNKASNPVTAYVHEKLHLPTLDYTISTTQNSPKLEKNTSTQTSMLKRTNTIVTTTQPNRLQTNTRYYNTNYNKSSESSSIESLSREMTAAQQQQHVRFLNNRKASGKSRDSELFEIAKPKNLLNPVIKQKVNANVNNNSNNKNKVKALNNNNEDNESCDNDLIVNDVINVDAEEKHLENINRKCTEWLEKYYIPYSDAQADDKILELNSSAIEL